MSFKLVNDLWTRDVGGTTQSVLFVLCDQANDFGECWPSQKLIAWKLGISKRTVIRIVQKLEAQGVLSIKRRFQSSNRYTIDLTKLPEKPPFEDDGQSVTYGDDISDTAMSPKEVTPDVTTEVTHVSPKPSVNHQDEPSSNPPKRTRQPYPEDFEEFWKGYPKGHGVKKVAYAEWQKLDGPERLAAIKGLDVWRRSKRWADGYIRDAERYLKYRMWENPPADVASSAAQRQPQQTEADPYWGQMLAGLEGEE